MRALRALTMATCLVAAAAGCAASSSTAKKDVTLAACTPGASGGHPTASGTILNHSSKASLYAIHVKFTDSAGNGVGDGVAAVGRVDAKGTAKWHANDATSAKGAVKCKVSSVSRTVSP